MHKRAFQALKRTFMHISSLPLPYYDFKNQGFKYLFFHQNMVGKTGEMHKRAFQGLKRTFMHVSSLPLPYFDFKKQIIKYFFFHQNMVEEDLRNA